VPAEEQLEDQLGAACSIPSSNRFIPCCPPRCVSNTNAIFLDLSGQRNGPRIWYSGRPRHSADWFPRLLHLGWSVSPARMCCRFMGKKVTPQGNAAAGLKLPPAPI